MKERIVRAVAGSFGIDQAILLSLFCKYQRVDYGWELFVGINLISILVYQILSA